MELSDAIYQRRSIRGFKQDPVPKDTVEKILDMGLKAPSAMNTQPWEVTVATGEVLENIKKDNMEAFAKAESAYGFTCEGIYRERQVELAKQIFKVMGIERHDREKRNEWLKKGFRFFDAPVGLIISIDELIEGDLTLFNLGCFSQNVCLAALDFGLGTCIGIQGVSFGDVIRKHTGITSSKKIIMGISLGYPDWEFPANKVVSPREEVDNFTTWLGF